MAFKNIKKIFSYDGDDENKSFDEDEYYTISKDNALKIALDDVKLTQSDIRDIDIELDYKYGQTVYEITFDYQQYEYEYYIDARNGDIVKSFKEID